MGHHRRLVLTYGTTMHGSYMRSVCPHAKLVGVGKVSGWKWIINRKKYANIVEDDDSKVYGLVYLVPPKDLKRLAKSEHHRTGRHKKKISIKLKKRHRHHWKKEKAYIYRDSDHESGGFKCSKSYQRHMRKALKSAKHHGVPGKYCKQVLKAVKKGKKGKKKSSSSYSTFSTSDSDSGSSEDDDSDSGSTISSSSYTSDWWVKKRHLRRLDSFESFTEPWSSHRSWDSSYTSSW